MRTFTDSTGRAWNINITVATVKSVRDAMDVRLDKAFDDDQKVFRQILTDLILLTDCLYVIVKPQADAAGISAENFGELMVGDVLEKAGETFAEALLDFFPNARLRAGIRKIEPLQRRLVELKVAQSQQQIEQELQTALQSATSWQDGSESTLQT